MSLYSQEAQVLNLLRRKTAVSNNELKKVCIGYRTFIQAIRSKGIDIQNKRFGARLGRFTMYVLTNDDKSVDTFYDDELKQYVVRKYPFEIFTHDPSLKDSVEKMHEYGRNERSIWSKLAEWFNLI